MQTNAMNQEMVVPGMLAFGSTLYATDPGVDHPTPPAPDPRQTGNKPKPAPAPAPDPKTGKKQ